MGTGARLTDVAVVGGGIVGLATAHALRRRGATVTLYERGEPGAAQSGGHTRIFRHAHGDVRLATFARESRECWDDWTEQAGEPLIGDGGAVALGPRVPERLAVLSGVTGVDARTIDSAELAGLLPLLAPYEGPAMFDPTAGPIRVRATIGWLLRTLDDALVRDEVLSVRPVSAAAGGIEIRTGGGVAHHGAAVVCAGAGTAALARNVGLKLPVTLEAHVRLTFAVRPPRPFALRGAVARGLPTLQDGSGAFGEPSTYGGPLPGDTRFVLGLSGTVPADPDGSVADVAALADLDRRASTYVGRALPGLDPEPVGRRHCWVTRLPWGDDALAVWQRDGLTFVAGANLFKQAPRLGDRVAAAALGDPLDDRLRPDARLGTDDGR